MRKILFLLLAVFAFNSLNVNAETGTENDPFLINDKSDLIAFSQGINGRSSFQYHGATVVLNAYNQYFKLTSDIEYNNMEFYEDGSWEGSVAPDLWTPIGFYDYQEWEFYCFQGTLEGDGHTISGLYCNAPDSECVGFFGILQGGKVNNLHISKAFLCGKDQVGGIAGDAEGLFVDTGVFDNAVITNCIFDGFVKGETQVGGIAGLMCWADALNCVNLGKVIGGESCGGIAGFFREFVSSIKYCLNVGEVVGNDYCGGITGLLDQALIESCLNVGWVMERNHADTLHYGAISGGNALNFGAVRNSFYDKQMCPLIYGVATDSVPGNMGNLTRKIISGNLFVDNQWVEADGRYPIPAGMSPTFDDALAVASAPISFFSSNYAYDKASDVQNDFTVCTDNGVSWTDINGNLTINGNNVTFSAVGEYAMLEVTKNDASRKITLFLNKDGMDITEISDIQLNIYPNPAADYVIINGCKIENVTLFDVTGRSVVSKMANTDEVQIDLSLINKGVYFLKINSDKTIKIVKD